MNRGDLVLVLESNSPASKSRPCVIVQRDSTLAAASKVTLCPLTSTLRGASGQRPSVAPSPENGLKKVSEVQADWVHSFPRDRLGSVIGRLDPPTMRSVDTALRRWLSL